MRRPRARYQGVGATLDPGIDQVLHVRRQLEPRGRLESGSEKSGWLVIETKPLVRNQKIIYLNEDYTQALVVGPTMRTLSIRYRDPDLTKRDLDALIARAGELGFKTAKLARVDQSIDRRSARQRDR